MKTICVLLIFVLTVILEIPTTSATATTTIATTTATPKIFITEIFPNPKGKDGGKEWIELFNAGNEQVNLDDWQISQTSTGKKKSENFYIKNLKIDAKSYTVISGENLKKPLRNKENTIALISPSGEVVVKIYYKSSKEENSLSLIKIIDTTVPTSKTKSVWLFTPPSKGEKNKDFYYMKGQIASTNNKTFTFLTKQNSFLEPKNRPKSLPGQTLPTIHYKNINSLLLKIFSKQKTTLTILASEETYGLNLVKITHAQ